MVVLMETGKSNGLIAVYLPPQLLRMVEETRQRLGMNRSRFIQYCLTKTLQELSVLTTTIHKPES
jgi:metal-responsive CopG/Arc/MetJ family transcriptional regulator